MEFFVLFLKKKLTWKKKNILRNFSLSEISELKEEINKRKSRRIKKLLESIEKDEIKGEKKGKSIV